MDLSVGSTALASIVGLIGQFLDQRRASETQTLDDFKAWLAENRHGEVIRLLELNANTAVSIKALLMLNRTEIQEQLGNLDRNLALIATSMSQFVGLARAVRPEVTISQHALNFLREFDASGAGMLLEITLDSRPVFIAMDAPGNQQIDYGDPRFLEDDLRQLVEARLLRTSFNSQGKRIFHLTREASSLAKQTPDPAQSPE
jgi:hypothetical protein